jgi:hypothetical protein
MSASMGDVLNQGHFALYVSNISEEGILLQGNNLWVPTGGGKDLPKYENLATAMGVALGGWSFGAQFGDLNNDGFLDLYLVNGYVSASKEETYWYDYAKVAGGHEIVISDAKNWPAMGRRSLGGYQSKKVWINDGAGRFIDVAPMVGVVDRHDHGDRSAAFLAGGAHDPIRFGNEQEVRTALDIESIENFARNIVLRHAAMEHVVVRVDAKNVRKRLQGLRGLMLHGRQIQMFGGDEVAI